MKVASEELQWIFCLIRISTAPLIFMGRAGFWKSHVCVSVCSFFFFLITLAWKFNQSSSNSRHVVLVFLLCLWEPANTTVAAVALKRAAAQPSYLVKSRELTLRRRTAAAQLSVTLTCLLFGPSRLWLLFAALGDSRLATFPGSKWLSRESLVGMWVRHNASSSDGDPPQKTWAKESN